MKVFTFFYNRYDTATTSLALSENGINHSVLIHNDADADLFRKGGTIGDLGKAVVTGNGKGLAYQRNTALGMMDLGEWGVFMCDDFQHVMSMPTDLIMSSSDRIPINFQNQQAFRFKKYEHESTLAEMFKTFPKLISVAEANRIHLVGFALHSNPQNLAKKFTLRGLADGRFWLVKKSHYTFDLNAQLIDDVAWTAENLVRHGNVLILNWILPTFKRYTAGGFGSQEQRIELRRKECAYLAAKYNPLVKTAKKPGWPDGTHIRLYGSDGNITAARKRLGIPTL